MAKGALASAQLIGDKVLAKPEWGIKRVCQSCSALFYDMRRSPILCPSCGTVFDTEQAVRVRRTRPGPVKEAVPVVDDAAEEVDLEGGVIEDIEEDEEEGILEDASDLGDDDDEIDVIKKGEGEGED